MGTKVYGASDDLIEVEGGKCAGEVGYYCSDDEGEGALLVFDDATVLTVKYGDEGIWKIRVVRKGPQFDRIDQCEEETDEGYSDIAHFKSDMKWCYAAKEWEKVQ